MIAARTAGIAGTVIGLTIASGLVSAPARAATVVTDWAGLAAAFTAGESATLGADITAPADAELAVPVGGTVTLDLHGHALTIDAPSSSHPAIEVPLSSRLVIDDSVEDAADNVLRTVGGLFSAAIGGPFEGGAGTITVQGQATVEAVGDDFAAGIGGGYQGAGGTLVTLDASTVTATGGRWGAGVGGGFLGAGGTLTTSDDSTLTATGGEDAAGIGGGPSGDGGTVATHGSSTVVAVGGEDGSGIGGGTGADGGSLSTHDTSSVTATGGHWSAGIGGGMTGNGGTVSTYGSSTVVATAGAAGGAGIGGGINGDGGTLTTNGASSVTTTGSRTGAGIGGDGLGTGGTVRLRGSGPVVARGGQSSPAVGGDSSTTVTIGAAASLAVSGGSAVRGAGVAPWGALTNAGTITIADDTTMAVSAGATVTNSGTIRNLGSITGAGAIVNSGRIVGPGEVANNGQGGFGTTVGGHSFLLSFDSGGVGPAPDPVSLLAKSAEDAERPLPIPTLDPERVFTGWYTAASGGTRVADTTDLDDLLGDGPVAATLHARYDVVQEIEFSSTAPTAGVVGGTYTPTAAGGDSEEPVVLSIDPATTNGACELVDDTVELRHVGTCVLAADQAAAPGYTAAETATQSFTVHPAATTLALGVTGTALTATVSSTVPGPAGAVTFAVDGTQVGSADLVDGTARLAYVVPPGQARTVSASYAGQGDHAGADGTMVRRDPTVTATLSASPNAAGWHRTPVTVTFTCTPNGAPLATACPTPVVLGSGAGQSASGAIAATDGGNATATATGISVDLQAPTVKAVRKGKRVRCAATDALSGVASCKAVKVKKLRGGKVRYRATATDQAGNTTVRTITLKPARKH